jgi:prepilin-type N-terminal cleavage/methylation domain-containing protein
MVAQKNLNSGFTLIELMITIAIIDILTAIAIPNFISYREKSKIAAAESEIKTIELAMMDLALDTNRWPTGNMLAMLLTGMSYGI